MYKAYVCLFSFLWCTICNHKRKTTPEDVVYNEPFMRVIVLVFLSDFDTRVLGKLLRADIIGVFVARELYGCSDR